MTDHNIPENFSRNELLAWVNITKIEHFGTGALFCQILDIIHPGKIALSKVNWKAKFEYEFIANLKLLAQAFMKLEIQKTIEVDRLSKLKVQENLDLIQWFKKYYDTNCFNYDYDALAKRGNIEPDFSYFDKPALKLNLSATPQANSNKFLKPKSIQNQSVNRTYSYLESDGGISPSQGSVNQNPFKVTKMKENPLIELYRAEKDFYFSKLRDIDHLMDKFTDTSVEKLKEDIRSIMFALPEKAIKVTEDGNVIMEAFDQI